MNTELERRKQEITRSQGRRKLWQRIVSALAAVVMFVTTYVLILPVEAQNRTFCEMEAHEHSAENGCYVETKTLKCEEKHEHTNECYITLLTLICQHEEHTHNKECYADKTADIETQADWEASIKAAKLTGEWSKDIISIASTQLGYRESDKNYILGENNEIKGYTRYGDWIGDKYVDWSAAFVAFCVNYTGISKDEMTYDKVPEEWVKALQNQKLYNETVEEVNPGDIVFIDENGDNKADRVGIVVENTEGKIKTVEGDLNNSVSYMEYVLPAAAGDYPTDRSAEDFSGEKSNESAAAGDSRADQADVDSSNEESNSKDFAEAKSTLGRAARAEEKLIIIGSVSLPANPNYNPPIAITDPENTTSPDDRIKETSSPENRVTPTTPPENRGITRASVPTLTNLDPTTKVAVLFNGNIDEFITLADALNAIDQASASEFTVVFTQNYSMSAADYAAMWTDKKGSSASKIYFTSCYNNGAADVTSAFAAGNYFIANTETEIYNLTFSGSNNIQGGGNKLTIGTGVVGNASSNIWGGLLNANLESDTDLSVFSGTWNYIGGGSYGAYTLNGNSSVYVGGTTITIWVSGGSHTAVQTGNTSAIVGGSVNATYALGGSYNHNIYGNTSLLVTDDAVVTQAYGGSWNESAGRVLDGEISLTLNGNAKATYVFLTSYGYGCSNCGPLTLTINGNAQVEQAYSGNNTNMVGTCGPIIYNIDGTDGAYVKGIVGSAYSAGTIAAGTEFDMTLKNMKDIRHIDASTRNNGSGKITIDGDCGVQYYFQTNANIDVELAENAALQMGSNSELTQAGNAGEFRGLMQFLKSLIMNANSKLIMAGDSYSNAYRTIKNIDVRGANAEIDIYKRAATIYPIQVSGEKLGSDELALGVFKTQDVDTDDPNMTHILLTFSQEPNAKEEDYLPGQVSKGSTYEKDLDGVHKNGNNIIVCKGMDDPIDVANGRLVFSLDCATQYVGDTNNIYAHDHALKPSYRIKGTNTTNYYNDKILVEPDVHVELIVCEDLYLYGGHIMMHVTGSYTTLTLLDNTTTTLRTDLAITSRRCSSAWSNGTNYYYSGCIVKNGMTGELTIQCQHVHDGITPEGHQCPDGGDCGILFCNRTGRDPQNVASHGINHWASSVGCHVAGIGSIDVFNGFSNFYVKGGVITVTEGGHNSAIGTGCGPAGYTFNGDFLANLGSYDYTQLAAAQGQICSNLNFSGGRTYAYGGLASAAIGSGTGTAVDGVYITNGAYVYARGGICAPGIGVGSCGDTPYNRHYYLNCENVGRFRNFVVSGGATVVESVSQNCPAIGPGGYVSASTTGITDDVYVPITFIPIEERFQNAKADPNSGYVAIIRQGDTPDRDQSVFIPGVPADDAIDVLSEKFYSLVYFTQIHKTAQVSSGGAFSAPETGTQASPVMINVSDTIKYTVATGIIADANGAISGSIVDELPEGMTFAGSPSPASGFSYSYDDTTKRYTVRWDNISFNEAHEFSVNVTVDNLPAGVNEKTFENQAVLVHSDGTNEIQLNSNWTYHKVVRQAPPEFDLTITKTVVGGGTGPFSFTVTFTDGTGAAVNIPQPAANSGYTVTNNVATFDLNKDGSVTITGIPVGTIATIVETSHAGYTVQYNFSDGTPSVSGDTASVTITDDLTVTCINNAGFELPHTGGTGSLILTLGGVILVATALMYGISAKRRQWRAWI